jgi:hypothetical protein
MAHNPHHGQPGGSRGKLRSFSSAFRLVNWLFPSTQLRGTLLEVLRRHLHRLPTVHPVDPHLSELYMQIRVIGIEFDVSHSACTYCYERKRRCVYEGPNSICRRCRKSKRQCVPRQRVLQPIQQDDRM